MPNLASLSAAAKNAATKSAADEDTGPLIWIGLVMIIVHLVDSSFPIFQILTLILVLYFYNNKFPIFQLLLIVLCVYLIFYMLKAIFFVITASCGMHKGALMLERFDVNSDALANYNKLSKRLNTLDKSILTTSEKVEKLHTVIENFQPDLCLIMKQIDDSNEGSYSSNIPEDESKLPAEKQEKRAAERAVKAKKYVEKTKTDFSASNGKVPLVECFNSDELETESALDQIKNEIDSTESNLDELNVSFKELKTLMSDKSTASYDLTLKYNERYIKKLASSLGKKVSEGFMDHGVPKDTLKANPNIHVQALEDTYRKLAADIDNFAVGLNKYIDAIKQQKAAIATAKGPVTDPKVQENTINASYDANKAKK